MSIYTRFFEGKYYRWLMILYLIVIIPYGIGTLFFKDKMIDMGIMWKTLPDKNKKMIEEISSRINRLEAKGLGAINESIIAKLDEVQNSVKQLESISKEPGKTDEIAISSNLKKINEKISKLDDSINNLQNALNPTTPIQVLTLARLGDEIKYIKQDLNKVINEIESIQETIDKKLEQNLSNARQEVDRITDLFKWLGILIIPLIISTMKDLFKGKPSEEKKD